MSYHETAMLITLLFIAVCFLAYANGANDNFKGGASLYGSGTCGYRKALACSLRGSSRSRARRSSRHFPTCS